MLFSIVLLRYDSPFDDASQGRDSTINASIAGKQVENH